MNLLTIFSRFPDQEACIAHLEQVRWGDTSACPYCGSVDVGRKAENERVGRWNCHDCKSSFNALSGTIFEQTKLPLHKWFLAIGLIINAKKSLSSHQLSRDLDLNQKSAWYMQQRIRAAMAADQGDLLQGIVEADETYIGGKPRKSNRRSDRKPATPGRGTSKTAVLGAVERDGSVKAQVAEDLTGRGILKFIKDSVDPDGSLLITDEFRAYKAVEPFIPHLPINHGERFSDLTGGHTNTIEGFFALLKRAWYGSHHHYQKLFSPLYVAEASWKYNHRRDVDSFGAFMRGCFA